MCPGYSANAAWQLVAPPPFVLRTLCWNTCALLRFACTCVRACGCVVSSIVSCTASVPACNPSTVVWRGQPSTCVTPRAPLTPRPLRAPTCQVRATEMSEVDRTARPVLSAFRLIEVSVLGLYFDRPASDSSHSGNAHERCVFSRSFVVYVQALAFHAWVDPRLPTSLTLPFPPSSSLHPHWPVEWCVFPLEV